MRVLDTEFIEFVSNYADGRQHFFAEVLEVYLNYIDQSKNTDNEDIKTSNMLKGILSDYYFAKSKEVLVNEDEDEEDEETEETEDFLEQTDHIIIYDDIIELFDEQDECFYRQLLDHLTLDEICKIAENVDLNSLQISKLVSKLEFDDLIKFINIIKHK